MTDKKAMFFCWSLFGKTIFFHFLNGRYVLVLHETHFRWGLFRCPSPARHNRITKARTFPGVHQNSTYSLIFLCVLMWKLRILENILPFDR